MNATQLLNNTPDWFQKDANKNGASIDLRPSSGYKEIMGTDFFTFFSDIKNCDGRDVDGWNWQVRRVDGLINLIAWKSR